MGATKTDHFTDKQNAIATLAKAIGHPARVAIIEYLMKVDSCICGDIVNELPLAQPNSFATFERTQKCRTDKRKH